MRLQTPILALMLSLTMLMTLPGSYTHVRAVNQSGPTSWSPFGPQTPQLIIHFYSDFDAMFRAFAAGSVDITDWPIQSSTDFNSFCGNADLFCTSSQGEFGGFMAEINGHPNFMGTPLRAPRTTIPASFTAGTTSAACAVGSGSLTITLRNQEQGATVTDGNNTLTVTHTSGFPSATVRDSGDPLAPSGRYQTPCLLAGTYNLRTSIYGGTTQAAISSNLNTAGVLNVNWNSVSNSKTVPARGLLGAAIAHLIDVPAFDSAFFGFLAAPMCVQASPSQGLSCPTQAVVDQAICQYGNHPWLNIVGCFTGATGHGVTGTSYRISTSTIVAGSAFWQTAGSLIGVPGGYAGHDDIRASCDDILSMNATYAIAPSGSTCNDVANAAGLATDPGGVYAHIVPNGNIVDYVRTSIGRKQFGTVVADTLNFLFGTPQNRGGGTVCWGACPNSAPRYYTINEVTPIVFQDPIKPDAWQLYTGFTGMYDVSSLRIDSSSAESGGVCGGASTIRPGDYWFYCNPSLDTDTTAGVFVASQVQSLPFFSRAVLTAFRANMNVPVFTFTDNYVENNGWHFQQCTGSTCIKTQSSIVNNLIFGTFGPGFGVGAYFSFLNMRQVPGYRAINSTFQPVPGVIRRGLSQVAANQAPYLSPFTWSNTPSEGDVILSVFDSMLQVNPLTSTESGQVIDWQTTSHSSSFNPTEGGCVQFIGCGTTTQIWHLRNDIYFQDGTPITATDAAYTIIAYRDVPSVTFEYPVYTVVSAMGLDCGPGQPCRTLQVKLQGQSLFYELGIGTLPLIPKHLWAPICGDPPVLGGTCANPAFDPMAQGIMIGDGPWRCVVPAGYPGAGHVGGSCIVTVDGTLGGQALTSGAKVFLTRYDGFVRCCSDSTSSELYKVGYADRSHSGKVDFFDLASVASAVGKADPYWCDPNIACLGGTVGLFNLALVNNLQDHGTLPNWRTFTGVDPQIDPFRCPATGC